jgi:hypothetical protein
MGPRKGRAMKLYLDTSVVSFLEADDAPEKQSITRLFWNNVEKGIAYFCQSFYMLK